MYIIPKIRLTHNAPFLEGIHLHNTKLLEKAILFYNVTQAENRPDRLFLCVATFGSPLYTY